MQVGFVHSGFGGLSAHPTELVSTGSPRCVSPSGVSGLAEGESDPRDPLRPSAQRSGPRLGGIPQSPDLSRNGKKEAGPRTASGPDLERRRGPPEGFFDPT